MTSWAAIVRPLRMVAVLLALTTACSGSSPTGPVSIAGDWTSSPTPGGQSSMSLAQSGTTVTGSSVFHGSFTMTYTVTGTYTRPDVTLEFVTAGDTVPMRFTGRIENSTTMYLTEPGQPGSVTYQKAE
jgi:hypothetical protein